MASLPDFLDTSQIMANRKQSNIYSITGKELDNYPVLQSSQPFKSRAGYERQQTFNPRDSFNFAAPNDIHDSKILANEYSQVSPLGLSRVASKEQRSNIKPTVFP